METRTKSATTWHREQTCEEVQSRLVAAEHELQSLTYAISHDLRAPLRTLYGFSTLLIRKYGEKLDGQPLDYLQRIISGAARLEAMIDALLNLSRTGMTEMHHEMVDLSAIASTVIEELRAANPERKVEVEVQQGIRCHGDSGLLRTVLQNLLHNAWKFSGNCAPTRIRLFARTENGGRWYCIADNGAGFAAGQADRLFKPFQRLHLETEFPGVGMGLALVKKIIERHGGSVHGEGAEGAGATFCFTVPEPPDELQP